MNQDEASGHWRTVDGVHIFLKGGVVTKGPAHLVGKKPSQFTRGSGESENRLHSKISDHESSYHAAVSAEKAKNADLHTVHGTSSHSGGEKLPSQHGAEISAHAEKYHAALKEFKASIEANGGHVTVAAAEKFKPHLAAMKATLHKAGFGHKAAMSQNFILPTEDSDARPVPMALAGFSREIDGQPVEYRRKEICRAGRTVKDVAGNPFSITRERIDQWINNFQRQSENGTKVFIPTKHTEILSTDNRGFVVSMERDGDSLYAVEQLIGADAIKDAARNDQSVYIKSDLQDDQGNVYEGEYIQHVALTPAPQITGLNGFAKVAASRGADAEAVVLTIATTSEPERSFDMKPEISAKLREKLGVAKSVTDEQLMEQVAEKFLAPPQPDPAQTAAMSKLTEERDALIKERDEQKDKVVAMSRLNPKVDEDTAFLLGRTISKEREAAIASGGVCPAVADEIQALLIEGAGNLPNTVAMSRMAGSRDPYALRLWEALRKNKPTTYGEKTGRQHAVAMSREPEDKLPKDGDPEPEKPADPKEVAKLRHLSGLPLAEAATK